MESGFQLILLKKRSCYGVFFHARSQTKLVTRLPSRLLPNTFGVLRDGEMKAGRFRYFLILPSAFFLSVLVLLEIKRSAGRMTGSAISSLLASVKLLNSYFLIPTFLTSAVG
jgi:hypothetical protein